MEGGYVNEAIINAKSNPEKVPNPLLTSAASTKLLSSPSQTQAFPSIIQISPTMNSIQTPNPSSSSSSSTTTATTVTLATPESIDETPNPATATNSTPMQAFIHRLRNFDLKTFGNVGNLRNRFNIRHFSKENFLGGQLKTKNGQKYVFNGKPTGMLVSKTCVFFTAIIILLALVFSILVTYFVTINSLTEHGSSCATNGHTVQRLNATPVATASMLGMPREDHPNLNPSTSAPSHFQSQELDPRLHNSTKYLLNAASAVFEGAGLEAPYKYSSGPDGVTDSNAVTQSPVLKTLEPKKNPKLLNATKHLMDAAAAILKDADLPVPMVPLIDPAAPVGDIPPQFTAHELDPRLHNSTKYLLDAASAVFEGAGLASPYKHLEGDTRFVTQSPVLKTLEPKENPRLLNATMHLMDIAAGILKDADLPIPVLSLGGSVDDATTISTAVDDDRKVLGHELTFYEGWNPLHYTITVEPNLATSSNNGSVAIVIERDTNVRTLEPIVLDVHNISISNVRVIRAANAASPARINDEIELDFDSEYGDNNATFVVSITPTVAAERNLRLILSLDFVSELTDTLQGIYKTSYMNLKTGKQEWMVSTQFSPIDARRAFPCFDRPDKKANFTISIIRETNKAMSLSNMPLYRSTPHRPGYTKDDFQTTPKMPTYLVAFIVSNLVNSHYSTMDSNLKPTVEIWTREENTDMTNYAYSMVRRFLPYYEHYFAVKYLLPKIDLVSIPDFGFSAMENWGLITFRDSSLLVPEDLERASSSMHMEYVALTIAHELAHQWFGNLITPKWWDDLWLKEGFACFMSYTALNAAHPEFLIMDTFTVYEFQSAMAHDADNSTHAISLDVKTTNDVRRIFDPITYSKGTILLRMLSAAVGEAAFREATQDLLKSFAYKNIHRDDVWNSMSVRAHGRKTLPNELNIKDIMDPWITQAGYPVVSVKRSGKDLIISQERYMLPTRNPEENSKWYIPITYETDDDGMEIQTATHWLRPDQKELVIENVFSSASNADSVLYLNLNRQGYYRVHYDNTSWLALKKKFSKLPRITRAQILDDALHLAQAEYLSYDIPLTFITEIFTSPDDELLWRATQQGIVYLRQMFHREPAYETFRAFMKFMVRPAFDKYGLNEPDNESHLQLQHRAIIAHMACKFNYDRCTMAAHLKYREWMSDSKLNPIKPNLKQIIYCTALAEGSFQEWYFAYKQYKRTTSASEKEQILTSLGCTTKPWLLSKYLNMTINPTSSIQKQDGARAFRAVAENPIGYEIAFEFLQTNIKEIAEYFGDGFSTLTEMISAITTYMNKDLHKQQLLQFGERVRKLGLTSVEKAIELAMERVNNNIYWREHSYYQLKGFLEAIVSDLHINIF